MLAGIYHKLTAPSTRFEKGNLSSPKQADAAAKVSDLESLVRDIGVNMAAIDETPDDRNSNNPNSIYGSVFTQRYGSRGTTPFTGLCELDNSGDVKTLNVRAGSTVLTVKSDGDKKEIHHVNCITGASYDGDNVMQEHQWAIFDGSKVKYKNYTFFSSEYP